MNCFDALIFLRIYFTLHKINSSNRMPIANLLFCTTSMLSHLGKTGRVEVAAFIVPSKLAEGSQVT
jgi:hypothetical protein